MRAHLAVLLGFSLACGKLADDDGVAGNDASPPVTATPAPEQTKPTRRGTVFLYSNEGGFGGYATFAATPQRVLAGLPLALGECRAFPRPAAVTPARDVDAGDIAITAIPADLSLVLHWDAASGDYVSNANVGYPTRGSAIQVQTTGSPTVPAFAASVMALERLVVVAPAEDGTTHPASADLVVRWAPPADTAEALPVEVGLTGSGVNVFCQFAASEGRGVIPQALVSMVATAFEPVAGRTCDRGCLTLQVVRARATHVTAGDFDVEVAHASTTLLSLTIAK